MRFFLVFVAVVIFSGCQPTLQAGTYDVALVLSDNACTPDVAVPEPALDAVWTFEDGKDGLRMESFFAIGEYADAVEIDSSLVFTHTLEAQVEECFNTLQYVITASPKTDHQFDGYLEVTLNESCDDGSAQFCSYVYEAEGKMSDGSTEPDGEAEGEDA
jgi:hypothetical protein